MATVNFSQKRKRLTAGLGVVFLFSSALIGYERFRNKTEPNPSRPAGQVRGESTASDPALAQERALAKRAISVLQDNVERLAREEEIDTASLSELQDALLAAIVPAPYQDMHLQLVNLTIKTQSRGQENINFLREQLRLLIKEYPWLAPSAVNESQQ